MMFLEDASFQFFHKAGGPMTSRLSE
ncbi:unnamed protein product [Ectocarpus sp. CCAP 1310/34]|nr:unnamed protein product [Ectocarpus sp. CCAP 1310/34]